MFLLVDDDRDGRITEYSESFVKTLSSLGYHSQSDSIAKSINDIVLDLNFSELKKTRTQRYLSNEIYENIHKLDLSQFSDNNRSMSDHIMRGN